MKKGRFLNDLEEPPRLLGIIPMSFLSEIGSLAAAVRKPRHADPNKKLNDSLDDLLSLYIVSIQMTNQGSQKVLRIDLNHSVPVYRQIADGMRALLVNAAFQPGDRLPTVRQLAIDLAVHHNTVAQAYRLLADEGWLELKRHRGAKVLERRVQPATAASQQNFLQRLRELTARAVADGVDAKTIARLLGSLADELTR